MKSIDSSNYIGQDALGYMVNAGIESRVSVQIEELQNAIRGRYGDAVWTAPKDALHITLLDWIAPLVEYEEDKARLFERNRDTYDQALEKVLQGIGVLEVIFNRIMVSPSAIALVADDSAESFNTIRDGFLKHAQLLPGTKMPPKIVHSTIARFIGDVSIDDSFEYDELPIEANITEFRLVKETTLPMLGYETIKRYPLK